MPLNLKKIAVISALIILFGANSYASAVKVIKSHAIAMHGLPKYPAAFERFEYTSPRATKGGEIKMFAFGTFDSLNGFIAKGTPADNLHLLYDTLTVQALDEPFTQYGLLAHSIEYPEDRSWVIYHLRPEAKFHDQHPITSEDVVFTFNLLLDKGNPAYKFFFADVEEVTALDTHRVKFTFKHNQNRELALTVGSLAVLPKHYWQDKEFDKSSLEVPLGSGPYQVDKVDPGRRISYRRVENYWGKDLAVNRGFYNFDQVSTDYYLDQVVALEGLKVGEYDFRWEFSSKFWATAYDIPAVQQGLLKQVEFPHQANSGIQAFIFNLRRPIFQDIALRKAITYAFDFEWSNETLFYKAYDRSYSFFTNSEFAADELPNDAELALLEPLREQVPESVFSEVYRPPVSDGSGSNRPNLRRAKKILDDAGYKVINNKQLINPEGQPIKFEILIRSPGFIRIINPFIKNLARLGIIARIRQVDTSQYINRGRSFDFDMRVHVFRQSESPGNEQSNMWSSKAANMEGSDNLIGINNPAVDNLVERVVNAQTREDLVIATQALDRVLLHNHYVIPQWFKANNRIAYWDKFGIPKVTPIYDRFYQTAVFTWWYDEDKANKLKNNLQAIN